MPTSSSPPPPGADSPELRRLQGARIRDHRTVLDLSQLALADLLGVSKAAVSEWERGCSSPRPHLQRSLAEALGTSWAALFDLDPAVPA